VAARLLIAELDRSIDEMAKNFRATKERHLLLLHRCGELSRLRCKRAEAHNDLMELLELAEMPTDLMGTA
jgi:hypothetical protein